MTEINKIDDKASEVVITAGDYKASIYTYGAILHSFSYKDKRYQKSHKTDRNSFPRKLLTYKNLLLPLH